MKWIEKSIDISSITLKIPDIIKEILIKRGIDTDGKVKVFLSSKRQKLYDPSLLPNIKEAILKIQKAKKNNKKIIIYGDYDVDGVTASAILFDFLKNKLNLDVSVYIPSRFDEGYGLNENALEKLSKMYNLLITVDCGVRDQKLINRFLKKIDFIVTDHHQLPVKQDFSYPVIHPRLSQSKYPFKDISGATVAYKFVLALAKQFNIKLNYDSYLDLVALSTVCDIMPLVDENRSLVKCGITKIKKNENLNLGLNLLIEVLGLHHKDIKAYHFGFMIGPRINASGRLSKAEIAFNLLTETSSKKAKELALKLNKLNQTRQEILQEQLNEAQKQVNTDDKLIFVYGENWHEGVIGLIAGKLTEKFNRPTICASIDKEKQKVVASARSIANFDITEAIGKFSKYLIRYGGHKQAGGLSLDLKNLEKFKKEIIDYTNKNLEKKFLEKEKNVDITINLADINLKLIKWIDLFEPFGLSNPNIVFEIKNVQVVSVRSFGNNNQYLRIKVKDEYSNILEIVSFFSNNQFKNIAINDRIDAIGNLRKNIWNGIENIQFNLIDFKKH